MASQSAKEIPKGKLAPSDDGEPAPELPSSSSQDPNLDSGEILVMNRDQAVIQDPGPQDNPQPQAPNHGAANVGENNSILGLSFPRKLWMILEDNTFTSVRWNDAGDTVIIDEDLFQREVLHRRGAERIFETDSLKTFIRLLNLYGFSKIRATDPWRIQSPGNKRMLIYRNANFQRDKPFLLRNIQRKSDLRVTTTWLGTSAPTPKRKKPVAATRQSPRIHHKEPANDDKTVLGAAPNAQGPSGSQSFAFSGIWSLSSAAGYAMATHGPSEPGGLSGEGTSRNMTFVPLATARRDDAGELPVSPPVYPDYGTVMSLYNTCFSILLAALSVMSPNEAPSENEEQEGSSDYKCALCEHFKENPGP
ncbi:heat shock transcription factor, X-linked member 3-like [Leopardus geoffroyi]|uniref:heat shock transcription factor, X-linked member 3-like n=1 Tax=Leopardus geoffroyi TaxID=46844 RepID=UPI001E26040B|nr:heat shock transcription factor, X-linked member 3-like [Leopardus geoffroyi]XP_045327159.1 heat shock transcription factor, X-linked member 3-like [Leopardus geoffroyi]